MPGTSAASLHALDALAQVRRVLVAGEDRDLALAAHLLGQLVHHRLAGLDVVDAVEREALRLRRRRCRTSSPARRGDRVVDRAGDLAGVRAGDQHRVRALVDRLRDALRLDLAVLRRAASARRSRSGTPCFCDSSLAAASAPVRAERKTGLVELLAIIAILIGLRGRRRGAVPPAVRRLARSSRVRCGTDRAATTRASQLRRCHSIARSARACRRLDSASLHSAAAARAAARAKRALAWSSTTATMIAQPMMIHS